MRWTVERTNYGQLRRNTDQRHIPLIRANPL